LRRERLVIGNWKMNPPTIADAIALAHAVAAWPNRGVGVGVAPPMVALPAVANALAGSEVAVYAQDLHWEERGAFTGQTSATMLHGVAVGSIVGHSEVRRDQGDDDRRVAKKVVRALSAELRVVLCVGESENEFAAGATEDVLDRQIRAVIRPVKTARSADGLAEALVIAYEPIWAIGTGRPATAAHATRAAAKIRNVLHDEGIPGDTIGILYGGSVSGAGAREFAGADGIDGALVGGASLKADEFAAIVDAFA
jgi:triosephosphate isomerase